MGSGNFDKTRHLVQLIMKSLAILSVLSLLIQSGLSFYGGLYGPMGIGLANPWTHPAYGLHSSIYGMFFLMYNSSLKKYE